MFCTNCGSKTDTNICPACGSEVKFRRINTYATNDELKAIFNASDALEGTEAWETEVETIRKNRVTPGWNNINFDVFENTETEEEEKETEKKPLPTAGIIACIAVCIIAAAAVGIGIASSVNKEKGKEVSTASVNSLETENSSAADTETAAAAETQTEPATTDNSPVVTKLAEGTEAGYYPLSDIVTSYKTQVSRSERGYNQNMKDAFDSALIYDTSSDKNNSSYTESPYLVERVNDEENYLEVKNFTYWRNGKTVKAEPLFYCSKAESKNVYFVLDGVTKDLIPDRIEEGEEFSLTFNGLKYSFERTPESGYYFTNYYSGKYIYVEPCRYYSSGNSDATSAVMIMYDGSDYSFYYIDMGEGLAYNIEYIYSSGGGSETVMETEETSNTTEAETETEDYEETEAEETTQSIEPSVNSQTNETKKTTARTTAKTSKTTKTTKTTKAAKTTTKAAAEAPGRADSKITVTTVAKPAAPVTDPITEPVSVQSETSASESGGET